MTKAKAPYSALHDLDANKPGGSIQIRVKTYSYKLKMVEEQLADESHLAPSSPAASPKSAWSCSAAWSRSPVAPSPPDNLFSFVSSTVRSFQPLFAFTEYP